METAQMMDLSKETIERIFMEQMLTVTRDSNKKLRSFERQFTFGVA